MPKFSATRAPHVRRLGWILSMLGACSVYDSSLLSEDRSPSPGTGGFSATGGSPGVAGASDSGSGGGNSDGSGGAEEGGQSTSGGDPGQPGGASQGGRNTGGVETGGSAAGGTTQTGGISQGGLPATGGTITGGGPSGGTAPTGGKAAGGTPQGGTTQGGAISTGGKASGGSSGATTGGSSGGADGCPDDPNKTAPGVCGCGIPEQDTATTAGCLGLRAALVHRYNFSGSGSAVTDSIGTANGTAVGATLSNGTATLAGTTPDQYIDLPNRILSPLTDATLEIWLTWNGGAVWQRVFDFGNSSAAEGTRANGVTYLMLTPRAMSGNVWVAFSTSGVSAEIAVNGAAVLPSGMKTHVSVVVNDTADQLLLYVNGTLSGSVAFAGHLSALSDVNNWLGRSQFSQDPGFAGILHEFRIYQSALSAAQIQLTEQAGESPAFL